MLETRHGKQYRYEMSAEDHEELLEALLRHKGPVLISGYDTELYQDMLCKWERRENVAYSKACSRKKEVLWMNFKLVNIQMSLGDFV